LWIPANSSEQREVPEFTSRTQLSRFGLLGRLEQCARHGNVAFILKVRVTCCATSAPRSVRLTRSSFCRDWRPATPPEQHSRMRWKSRAGSRRIRLSNGYYSGLPDDPSYKIASKYLKHGFGGWSALRQGWTGSGQEIHQLGETALASGQYRRRQDAGDSSGFDTHSQLTPAELEETGATPDYIRLSVVWKTLRISRPILTRP